MDIMPPENQLSPHHAPTGLKLWLAVFGVVLVAALGYLVWAQNNAPDTTDNSAATVKTNTVSTANWKTYTNTAYGYSFKYPSSWKLNSTNPALATLKSLETASQCTSSYCPVDIQIYYYNSLQNLPGSNPSITSLEQLASQKNVASGDAIEIAGYSPVGGIQSAEILIGGQPGVFNYLVPKGGHYLRISFDLLPAKSELTSVEKQFISNFKFTK